MTTPRPAPAGWPLRPTRCPCDLDFVDWLRTGHVRGAAILHFGTGSHHVVGRDNHRTQANVVIGVTASDEEHERYRLLVAEDPELTRTYQVWCTDIYRLPGRVIPPLDIATLFHLCEFSRDNAEDRQLLATIAQAVRPGGLVLFYPGSDGFRATEPLIAEAVAAGVLVSRGASGSLTLFEVMARAADGAEGRSVDHGPGR